MRFTRMSLIALAGLLLVLAGPAQDAAGYGLCGYDWTYKADPMDETYRINPNALDASAGTTTEQIDAINRSYTEWNTTGEACFEFTYGGTSTGTSVTFNGVNLMYFDPTPPDGGGYVAANYHWVSGGNMSESDIVFNEDYTWNSTGIPGGSEMDIENIATHELGHTLCLLDLYGGADSAKTMYGYVGYGEYNKRTLHSDDINGIQAIYGYCAGSCTDDGYEENDSFAEASAISAGTISNLQICADDQDYFSFSVTEGANIQVDIAFTHANGNLSLYLYNPAQSQIDISTSSTDDESVSASGVSAGTYYARVLGASGAENSYNLTLTITAATDTIHVAMGCVPTSGTLPYIVQLWPQLCNDDWFTRKLHGKINVTIAGGTTYDNWRAGSTNVSPGGCYTTTIGVNLPNLAALHGVNTFTLIGTDITAPPYNQPPYSPSGDTDSDFCVTTGN